MPAVFGMHAAAFVIKGICATESGPMITTVQGSVDDRQSLHEQLPMGHMYNI